MSPNANRTPTISVTTCPNIRRFTESLDARFAKCKITDRSRFVVVSDQLRRQITPNSNADRPSSADRRQIGDQDRRMLKKFRKLDNELTQIHIDGLLKSGAAKPSELSEIIKNARIKQDEFCRNYRRQARISRSSASTSSDCDSVEDNADVGQLPKIKRQV